MAIKKAGRLIKSFIRPGDVLAIMVVVILAALSFYGFVMQSSPGVKAIITTPGETFTMDLSQNMEKTITGHHNITLTLEVADGSIRFRESQCPDKICVGSGWLSKTGQTAACLPAGISVQVTGGNGNNNTLDAVAE